jgi:DNA-binding HxlR family transcriptional regulator
MKLEKVTSEVRRRYEDACGTAHALDLIGERWSMLVMRELMLGPRRFGDLRASLPGLSANVLTQRLEGLEGAGILRRRRLAPPASVQVYELTDWGLEAEPIIRGLGRWAARSPLHDPTLPLSAVSLILSLRTMFDADKAADGAAGVAVTLGLRFGEEVFTVRVRDGRLEADRGEATAPDVTVSGRPDAFAGLIYGFLDLKTLERECALTVGGDRDALARFTALWALPPKAEA